ncbi:MAG: hypothetical protein C4521_12225 [Actinobacteria bacterium]|nr:MAG: hypothetical protein C4521_12225 [Actinomycetota bacterium]
MAVENALHPSCTGHEPPNDVSRLMRNIILGSEFVMSHITHFYTLAAVSYVQGPGIAPWTPYFDSSYYVGPLIRPQGTGSPAIANPVYNYIRTNYAGYDRAVPDSSKSNVPYAFGLGAAYTGLDGIWDNVIFDYVTALKFRRDAANASAILGGRTPQIQNGCLVGGSAKTPSAADVALVKSTITACAGFVETHQIPLTQIVSYLYGNNGQTGTGALAGAETAARVYDNDGSDPMTGFGAGAATGVGANRVLAWGVFDEDMNGGDDPNRLLKRGCYEWNGSAMVAVDTPANLVGDLEEYIDSSRYDDDADKGAHPKHPSEGYTNPNAANGYSWAKSPRINGKACQVGPLARMAVQGERAAGTNQWDSYQIGTTKNVVMTSHPYLGPIVTANLAAIADIYGPLPAPGFLCGFSTMDRHRARAYEALKIAKAVQGWCDDLTTALGGDHYTAWTMPTSGTQTGYGAHEAPRGALAHFIEVTGGRISNYQAVVPTTWNVNPEAPAGEHGPIESAIIGINVAGTTSGGHTVSVEALRVVQGFDPCIACTVH